MRNLHLLNPIALRLAIGGYQAMPENSLEKKGPNPLFGIAGDAFRKHFGACRCSKVKTLAAELLKTC